jgi:Fungalysin metallopeptidase (M36)
MKLGRPPNLDLFLDGADRSATASASAVAEPAAGHAPRLVAGGRIAYVEKRLGVPTFFWASRPVRRGQGLREQGITPEQAARRHLLGVGDLYRRPSREMAESARLSRIHHTARGAVIASFHLEVDGVRVFRDQLHVVMDRSFELVALSGYLPPHQRVGLPGEPAGFPLSNTTAIAIALFDLTGIPVEGDELRLERSDGDYHAFELRGGGPLSRAIHFGQPARARRVLFTLPDGLAPAYHVELDIDADDDHGVRQTRMYGYVVSAVDGRILFRKDLEQRDAFTYRVWADGSGQPWDGPHGTRYSPHPTGTPNALQPQWVAQKSIVLESGPISTRDPWLPATATSTVGNNVDAYADLASPNGYGPGDVRAPVTARTLDFLYDQTLPPNATPTQIQAAVTQLFVDANFFHDWYYDVGFDEAAGNAQADNFGRGGKGGDPLLAEAQDYSGTNNANMQVPADGYRPRMQMFLFTGGSLARDGTLDNAIVAHEWGHLISNRLIGDSMGLSNLQGLGMGEGWADFHALLMLVRAEDAQAQSNAGWSGVFPMSSFATSGTSSNALYFGLRRYPYSTDFAKNPLTFKHIQGGVPLPAGVPVAQNGGPNWEVHNTGEVWAEMLWECYAALLNDTARLSFVEAQDRMRAYLVGGYKATPNAPTFLEARDAILAVALANDPADFQLFRKAFARRGAGDKAVAPPRNASDNAPVVEDFSATDGLELMGVSLSDSVVSCDHDGWLDNGETGTLTVTLRNAALASLSGAAGSVTTSTPGVTLPRGGALRFGPSSQFGTTSASVDVKLDDALGITALQFVVSFGDSAERAAANSVNVAFRGNVAEMNGVATTDTVESSQTLWSVDHDAALTGAWPWRRAEISPLEHVWFGPNPESPADVFLISPPIQVGQVGDLVVSFKHRYDFEYDALRLYDGGVLEVGRTPQGPWTDVGSFASPGYDGVLADTGSFNPLRGRRAYSGKSDRYPEFIAVTVNLGTTYAGQTVFFRFRIGSDGALAHYGWEIDDIAFSGIVGTPFPAALGQQTICGTPVADAGGARQVRVGEALTLVGAGTDEDGDPLTFEWAQVEGPTVPLEEVDARSVRFVAPDVEAGTRLRFALTVSDGKWTSDPSYADVTILAENRAPIAAIEAPESVARGGAALLDGSASSDPDGDVLTYHWKQIGGPAVTLASATDVAPAFTAPDVDGTLTFELMVSDGSALSQPAVAVIRVGAGADAAGCGCHVPPRFELAPAWALWAGVAALLGRRRAPSYKRQRRN